MKRAYLKYFSAFLVASCLSLIVPVMASNSTPVTIAQATSTYNKYMSIGYAATNRRDFKTALINFRRALQLRPKDKYATQAINNVSSYAKALRSSKIAYVPRNTGAPIGTEGAATRGGNCSNTSGKSLIALVPQGEALTTVRLPVLLVYMPQNVDTKVEFVLVDSNRKNSQGEDTYHTFTIAPSKNAGIVSLDLATFPGLPSLENEKTYQWFLSLVCDETDRSGNPFVQGLVKKVALDPLLVKELQAAKLSDRAALYAANGIWYDALAALYQARQSSPNDPATSQSWANLLNYVALKKDETPANKAQILANEPLIKCCMASRNKQGLNP